MGDGDRHSGNYMFTPDGKMMSIDMGQALVDDLDSYGDILEGMGDDSKLTPLFMNSCILDYMASLTGDKPNYHAVTLDSGALSDMADKSRGIIDTLAKQKVKPAQLAVVREKAEVLKRLSKEAKPTAGDMLRIAREVNGERRGGEP